MLSSEKLLSIAERENKSNIRNICDLLFGIVDLFSFILIILPFYPNITNGYIHSVNLFDYKQISQLNLTVYWIMFISLVLFGAIKVILTKTKAEKSNMILTEISLGINIFIVLFLIITRQVYAVIIAFLLLIIKSALLLRYIKSR